MSIIRIGQFKRINVCFVPFYQTVSDRAIHHLACSFENSTVSVRFSAHQCIDPFLVNFLGPLTLKQAIERQLHEQITQRSGIQDIGIE